MLVQKVNELESITPLLLLVTKQIVEFMLLPLGTR